MLRPAPMKKIEQYVRQNECAWEATEAKQCVAVSGVDHADSIKSAKPRDNYLQPKEEDLHSLYG